MKKSILASAFVAVTAAAALNAQAVLKADFSAEKTEVSPNLFGIFYEDINYAVDGGLYGEMLLNRSFEYRNSNMSPTENWSTVNLSGKKVKSKLRTKKESPLNENNPVYAHLDVVQKGDGIANAGFNGLYLEAGKTYPGSVYLRSPDGTVKTVTITAGAPEKKAKGIAGFFRRLFGKKNAVTVKISGITTQWQKFTFDIKPRQTAEKGQLSVCAGKKGALDIDFVSLFRADIYRNEPNGLREDLAKKLEEMHPAFVRFPGGCIVQGKYLADRYQWKDTIGPVEQRKENFNFWGYQQSYGLGFYEYFRLCEDIGAEPIPILNCGLSWEGENDREGDIPMDQMQPFVDDALDLIEWATGSADSEWGRKRAEAGHPEPFALHYLGIGNEDGRQHYWERYELMAKAVKEKYPEIELIISAGAFPSDLTFFNTWAQVRDWEKASDTKGIANLVDEHYYSPVSWFLANGNRYDDKAFYPRGKDQPHVFIGEYAAWDDARKNSLQAALAEAAYMTSIERNGDIIEIAAYAPLFARDGKTQWAPDMIWFNDKDVFLTPNYYMQQLFMTHKSDVTVQSTLQQPVQDQPRQFIGGTTGLGTWLTTADFKDIKLTDNTNGEVVYNSATDSDALGKFRKETGSWAEKGGVITQSSTGENMRAVLDLEERMKNVDKYTYELSARKTGGDEGFLIMFGVKGKSLYWWNMGGWGNTQSVIEKGTASGRSTIGNSVPMELENNVWYKIRIEVDGETYRCYLDGKLMHEFTDVMNFNPLYTHVGETSDGKIYVKIVNISEKAQPMRIVLDGAGAIASEGTAVIVTGEKPSDENSFKNPAKVAPKTAAVSGVSGDFEYTAEPYSATVLELKKE